MLNLNLSEELQKELEALAARQRQDLEHLVEDVLQAFVQNKKVRSREEFEPGLKEPFNLENEPVRKSINITEYDPDYRLSENELQKARQIFEEMQKFSEELGGRYQDLDVVDAVELVREGRREF